MGSNEMARYEPRAPGLRRGGNGRGQPGAHLRRESSAEAAASSGGYEGIGVGVLGGEEGDEVGVGGVAHPVVGVAPRPPMRRHGEGDFLRHGRRREGVGVLRARMRWEGGAAAAGGREEAEERGEGGVPPAEHRAGSDRFRGGFGFWRGEKSEISPHKKNSR
jgi:hypothetical protein